MILVIDAYNMLKQLVPERDISQSQRTQFITILKRYVQRKKHAIILVFDGGSYQWLHKEQYGNIQVIYSGLQQTADDYISYYLTEHQYKDMLLVSADHELTGLAATLSIPSIDPMDFYTLIQQTLLSDDKQELYEGILVKMHHTAAHEDIDSVMEQASRVVPIKHADKMIQLQHHIIAGSQKGSKIERKLLQILKKL